ncbi:MAG: M23 family metallopeptidase [Bacteroidota bacterium]
MDFEVSIAGSFGELRGNHFHSGIDFKTGGKEGIPVYSAGDGFVYRILVSRAGYGKALYIKHDNDITTVYAHLRAFAGVLADSILEKQTAQENFELDYYPQAKAFPVKNGDLIGFSGNSGSSEGPHLHFETRRSSTEKPFDPSEVGFVYQDTIAPILEKLFVYNLTDTVLLFPLPEPRPFTIKNNDTIEVGSIIAMGLSIYDRAGREQNKLGVRSIKVIVDGLSFFQFRTESFTFAESKHITAVIDQKLRLQGKESFLCLKASGNKLPFYHPSALGGVLLFKDGEVKKCNIILEDMSGNISKVDFWLMQTAAQKPQAVFENENCNLAESGEKLILESGLFKVEIDSFSIHGKSCVFAESVADYDSDFEVYKFGPDGISIFKPIKVAINIKNIPKKKLRKTVLARSGNGADWVSIGGSISSNSIIGLTSTTGFFTLKTDRNGPKIGTAEYFIDVYSKSKALVISISDDLSGVENVQCKIKGKWVLSEYNSSRNKLIIYDINKHSGERIKILATDKKGNKTKSSILINLK